MVKRRNRPLRVAVANDELTISIGIDTLAFAALRSPYAWELMGKKDTQRPDTRFRIADTQEYAEDVTRELLDEAEDGTNMLNAMLDEACKRAIEQGSIAFVDTEES